MIDVSGTFRPIVRPDCEALVCKEGDVTIYVWKAQHVHIPSIAALILIIVIGRKTRCNVKRLSDIQQGRFTSVVLKHSPGDLPELVQPLFVVPVPAQSTSGFVCHPGKSHEVVPALFLVWRDILTIRRRQERCFQFSAASIDAWDILGLTAKEKIEPRIMEAQ